MILLVSKVHFLIHSMIQQLYMVLHFVIQCAICACSYSVAMVKCTWHHWTRSWQRPSNIVTQLASLLLCIENAYYLRRSTTFSDGSIGSGLFLDSGNYSWGDEEDGLLLMVVSLTLLLHTPESWADKLAMSRAYFLCEHITYHAVVTDKAATFYIMRISTKCVGTWRSLPFPFFIIVDSGC